jgi:predicted metal-dependent hydrolase
MDEIPVRQLRFTFDETAGPDPLWSRSNPDFSMFINALGVHVPHFERFLVKVMRSYRDELDDPQLLDEVKAIIGQEAHHAFNFIGWNKAMERHYPGIMQLDAHANDYFQGALKTASKKFQIGYTAGYETFTFLAGMIILNRYEELMHDADPTLRALWVWHQVEEVEHGAVAFDFFQAFYPEALWYRRWMVVRAFVHISHETFKSYALMVRKEGYYATPKRALKAWTFFVGFAFDLGRSALPVLARNYHPRQHPICNDEQSQIAVAWRKYHAAGNDTLQLDNDAIEKMLAASAG